MHALYLKQTKSPDIPCIIDKQAKTFHRSLRKEISSGAGLEIMDRNGMKASVSPDHGALYPDFFVGVHVFRNVP